MVDHGATQAAARYPRRSVVGGLAAGFLGGLIGPSLATARAADAPNAQGPASGPATLLFVQSALGGSFTPAGDAPDRFTLTLQPAGGHVTYFTDRPVHEAGLLPVAALLDNWPFDLTNPPNAALALETASDAVDVAVLELVTRPTVAADGSVTYGVRVLPQGTPRLSPPRPPLTADRLPPTFGAGSLFIDSADGGIIGVGNFSGYPRKIGIYYQGPA